MKKVFFSSIHPAPYVDRWINSLSSVCDLTVAYNYKKSAAKTWKDYTPITGLCYEEIGAYSWLKQMLRCDYIILGGWCEKINILSLIVARLLWKKLAVFSDHPYEVRKYSLGWVKKKLILSFVPNIFCATHSTINYYKDTFGYKDENLFFFPYTFDLDIPDLTKYNETRNNALVSGAKIKMFVANNFRERKGYKCLYEAFKIVCSKGLLDKFEITIAGSGEEFEKYSSLIKSLSKDVKFLGWIDSEDYLKLMADTDIFVHASIFEPFSIPPIDAMKRGKLLVASTGVKSTELLLKNGQNGYKFDADDSYGLAEIIETIAMKPEIIYDCGKEGCKDVDSFYNDYVYADTLKKAIYEE